MRNKYRIEEKQYWKYQNLERLTKAYLIIDHAKQNKYHLFQAANHSDVAWNRGFYETFSAC